MKNTHLHDILLAVVFILVVVGMYFYISKNLLTNSKASPAGLEAAIELKYKLKCRIPPLNCGPMKMILGNQIFNRQLNEYMTVDPSDSRIVGCRDCLSKIYNENK